MLHPTPGVGALTRLRSFGAGEHQMRWTAMDNSVESSLGFVRSLAALTERLAKHDIVVNRLHCDWSIFGSWFVEATSRDAEAKRSSAIHRQAYDDSGPVVLRVTWDARDRRLSLESTPTEVISMLNKWRELEARSCDTHEAALALTQEWLSERLGSSRTL